ncbi:MAG TPA: hypothetical protein VMH20_14220 [Verrucomicrobiae bacterium]|nr:hypothetical protein [Verrucomicrobiae bacterium]
MRRLLVLGSLSSVLAFAVAAQQHAAVAPPPAPAHPVASGPSATGHLVPAHPSTHVHSGSPAAPVRSRTPVATHKPSGTSTAQTATPVLGGAVNSIGAVNSVTGNRPPFCNHPRNNLPGVNACAPNNGVVIPLYGGGIYVPIPYYDYADNGAPDQEPPQEVAADQPPDAVPPGVEQGQQPMEPAQPGPPRYRSNDFNGSLAQFVFVERDGTKVYAVAYSFNNNKLQYVTSEGIRHTLAIDSLDFDATQKQNEKLGNTINLPSAPASGVA